ncbi:FimV/HubP family polar landmark protein, partial [Pseudoalteromonas luteoviolacea]
MRGLALFCILALAFITSPAHTQVGTVLKGPKGVDYGLEGRSVGPIRSSDTLWRVAQKIRPDDSVTIYQVMKALYDKNPGAFLDQNLNHMRDGAYLRIPTLAEIRRVNPGIAKQKSDQDDVLWERKKNGTLNQSDIDAAKKRVTQARKVDVEQAQKALTNQLRNLRMEQDSKLLDLQNQFKSSVQNVEDILEENNQLRKQLSSISDELQNVREQLGKDSEIQQQLKVVIDMQSEMIAQQEADKKAEQESSFGNALSNPLVIALLATIPALLIVGLGLMFFLRKRKQAADSNVEEDEFLPQAPVSAAATAGAATAAAADPLDLDMPVTDDISPLDESVQLDDDILPEDDDIVFDSLDDEDDGFETGSSTLDQDELDSLLNDDIVFDDESPAEEASDDIDDFLQQSFDSTDDALDDEVTLDVEESTSDGDDILSADDIDDLFNEVGDEQDDTLDVSDDALAALSEELAEEPAPSVSGDEEFDLDDIDSLIDEAAAEPPKLDEAEGVAENDSILSADDIDDLLDGALDDEELASDDDGFELDDVDGLIDEAQQASEEQQGIDDLISQAEQGNELADDDDIDALLAEAGEEPETDLTGAPEDELDNVDDILAEVSESDLDTELEAEVTESAIEDDLGDIDDLLADVGDEELGTELEAEVTEPAIEDDLG